MNAHTQHATAPSGDRNGNANEKEPLSDAYSDAPVRTITGKDQAVMFFDDLEANIGQLLDVLDRETELLRAGQIDDSLALAAKKSALATTYARRVAVLKANADMLGRLIPVEIDKLRKRREDMETALKTNIAVLSAARAVSDALVKGVAGEVAKKKSGPTVYGGGGAMTAPKTNTAPLTIDRAM